MDSTEAGPEARGSRGVRAGLSVALLGMMILTSPQRAWAHQDPPGCMGAGVNAQLFVMFADGSDATGATFTPCESIHYMAQLCPSGGTTCNVQGDAQTTWTITTPDGVVHNVLPPGGIPLITGTSPCVNSLVVDYTVNVAGPFLDASTDLTRLITHSGVTDSRSTAGTGISNDEGTCPASTQCADSRCDPNLQFMTGL